MAVLCSLMCVPVLRDMRQCCCSTFVLFCFCVVQVWCTCQAELHHALTDHNEQGWAAVTGNAMCSAEGKRMWKLWWWWWCAGSASSKAYKKCLAEVHWNGCHAVLQCDLAQCVVQPKWSAIAYFFSVQCTQVWCTGEVKSELRKYYENKRKNIRSSTQWYSAMYQVIEC